jgi:hypothetical protein
MNYSREPRSPLNLLSQNRKKWAAFGKPSDAPGLSVGEVTSQE